MQKITIYWWLGLVLLLGACKKQEAALSPEKILVGEWFFNSILIEELERGKLQDSRTEDLSMDKLTILFSAEGSYTQFIQDVPDGGGAWRLNTAQDSIFLTDSDNETYSFGLKRMEEKRMEHQIQELDDSRTGTIATLYYTKE